MKKLRVEIATEVDCGFVNAARPDDVNIPEGMEIDHICVEGRWHIVVQYVISTHEDIYTLKNTLDEIVKSLQLIESVINL